MNNERPTIGTTERQEGSEQQETPLVIENPDELRERMRNEADKKVDGFHQECATGLEQMKTRSEADGTMIDPEDEAALRALGQEADMAKQELQSTLISEQEAMSVADRTRDNAEAVSKRTQEYRDRIEKLEGEIAELDIRIDEQKSSLINRIVNYKQIRSLEYQRSGKTEDVQGYKKFLEEDEALKKSYETIVAEEGERERVIREENQARETAEAEKVAVERSDREARDVRNLMNEHGCFFVHNIVDDVRIIQGNPEEGRKSYNTALDKKELDWSDRIDIVCGLEPTLSVSTISKPEHATYRQDKSTFTLLLKGGRVLAGSPGDLWTTAEGLKSRAYNEESATTKNIKQAIGERGDISYNEIVVADPEVGGIGFYWPTDSIPEEFTQEYVENQEGWDHELVEKYNSLWEKIPKLLEKRMDLFIMVNNQPRVVYDIDLESRSFKVASVPDKPKDICSRNGLSDLERKGAMGRVVDRI